MDNLKSPAPLVSVVMPAYKAQFLPEALDSLLAQSYRPIELVVCDDSTTPDVELTVQAFADRADFSVRYHRNESRLYETRSTARAIAVAEGEYIKFLHDDDALEPCAIERLVGVMQACPQIALAGSRRQLIDEQGHSLPDTSATVFPFGGDVVLDGKTLTSFLAEHTFNFIGEPSTVMCRRSDVLSFGEGLSALNGVKITWVADLALYVKLLQRGHLAFLSAPLTRFRVSRMQFSQIGRERPGVGNEGHANFRRMVRELGWASDEKTSRHVGVATLSEPLHFEPIDLVAALSNAQADSESRQQIDGWIAARVPTVAQRHLIEQRLEAITPPSFRVVVRWDGVVADSLRRTLDSLAQARGSYAAIHGVVLTEHVIPFALPGDIALLHSSESESHAALNEFIQADTADWLLLLDAGDMLTPSGLLVAGLELAAAPGFRALYMDAVQHEMDGTKGLVLRPDLNLDLLLSFPCSIVRHCLFNRQALVSLGGFDPMYAGAPEFHALLGLIEEGGLAGLGHVPELLIAGQPPVLAGHPDERRTIERHLATRGYTEATVSELRPNHYRIQYGHSQQASVSIVVRAGNDLALLQRCVESILESTQGVAFELLLLDHGQCSPEVSQWLCALASMGESQLRVLNSQGSREAAINQAAGAAKGDFLLLLADNVAVLDADWLAGLLNHALRPEVGVVGGTLVSAEGKLRHAGLLLGLCGPAGRAFYGRSIDSIGYMHRMLVDQNYSAVSLECLMISRALFVQLDGLDEGELGQAWGDVDLCLKAREAGYLTVWTPHVRLLQDDARWPASTPEQDDLIYARWLSVLARDPAYNPGLSLQRLGGFKLSDVRLSWRPMGSWKPVPRILAHPADLFGCGHYRIIYPFEALEEAGKAEGAVSVGLMHPADLERYEPDAVILQRQIGDERLEAMRRLKAFSRAFKIYELDDYLPNVPVKSVHRKHMPKDIVRSLRRGMSFVDRIVVTTDPLAEAFHGYHPDIRVVPNRLPTGPWGGLKANRRNGERLRVGWAGGASHTGDLELIVDVVRELAKEVDWIFLGMCPEVLKPYVKEWHQGVGIERYAEKLASLDLDLAIAPLEDNPFNICKSNLKLLEYGACGFPVVCSNLAPYQGALPVTRVKNRFADWVDAIRGHMAEREATARLGDELRVVVRRDWLLAGQVLDQWRDAWTGY
ncbi:glycosyltransferase [Pseudomonas stutzeri]|uniref:glycosyltransferase n=1 Tax=Stutzerimonas stutzeri TaxID=316 RepID=UPI00210D5767|nr:glycosyltransferase [Stutzerimonas stutzeri]MCQ4310750.1 glycosyltransferase [Stutzerimonas stutzeri]